jgi:hypothetical protein
MELDQCVGASSLILKVRRGAPPALPFTRTYRMVNVKQPLIQGVGNCFPRNFTPDFLQYTGEGPEMSSQLREVTRGQNSERETTMPQMSQRLLDAVSRQRKYQLRHKRTGLCYDCSRPAASGTVFCELHRRKRNLENRERQRERFRRKIRYRKAESYKFTGSNAYERKSAHIFRSAM